jgi:hypothetical protein
MAGWRQVFHFFAIASPVPRLMRTTFWGVTACAVTVVAWDASRAVIALTPMLALQLFATSSGFLLSARRGHYDLLLTRGHSRLRIATVHWAVCAWPGLISWSAVAAAEIVTTGGIGQTLVQAGTLSAVLIVSTLPWAVTVALPRFAGAVGWLVTLALLMTARTPGGTLNTTQIDSPAMWIEAIVAVTLYPPLIVGQQARGSTGVLLTVALSIALVSFASALGWIRHQDIPLEASQ